MPTAQVNGISIYYETQGSGEPILIVGGLATDLTQLQKFTGLLAEKREAVSFDSRGVGRSDKPDSPYTIEMLADDASGLLAALGIPRADVLGVSLGGRVALTMALQHPGQVGKLVLLSTSARMSYRRGVFWRLSNQLLRLPHVRSVGTRYPQPYYAYVRQRDASKGFDVSGRLGEIMAPTLVLHG
ncbi:MAG TPA: alpha/beta hydrolase, partial [Nitrososphaerales archaeon]|nr:alpha/beta hydrolase [Nitrososphaerales archaeon]